MHEQFNKRICGYVSPDFWRPVFHRFGLDGGGRKAIPWLCVRRSSAGMRLLGKKYVAHLSFYSRKSFPPKAGFLREGGSTLWSNSSGRCKFVLACPLPYSTPAQNKSPHPKLLTFQSRKFDCRYLYTSLILSQIYSGTPLIQTLLGPFQVSCLVIEVSWFRGLKMYVYCLGLLFIKVSLFQRVVITLYRHVNDIIACKPGQGKKS